jgi:hypothetical protein
MDFLSGKWLMKQFTKAIAAASIKSRDVIGLLAIVKASALRVCGDVSSVFILEFT